MPKDLAKPKQFTALQQSFLEHLSTDAKGDLKKAKELAGYSDDTRVSEIILPLKDEIIGIIKDVLAYNGVKAAFGLIDILDTPSKIGASNQIKASTEILDRIGVVKQEQQQDTTQQGTIFILPPKEGKVTVEFSSAKVIDMEIDN